MNIQIFRKTTALMASFVTVMFTLGIAEAGVDVPKEYLNYFKPITQKVVDNPENPVTPVKAKLGKMLYFEPRLSKSGLFSCNTCHNLSTGGVSNLPTDIGHRWAIGPINGPTVLNSAFNILQFWDGRAKDLEEQAQGPILNPSEMGMPDKASVVERIKSIPEYVKLFSRAFPKEKEPLTYENIARAIAVFERTLLTPGRFDRFLQGDSKALTDNEKKGLLLFTEKGCVTCHNGVALGGNNFQKIGVVKPFATSNPARGRIEVTKDENDLMHFKVPILRNVEKTYPYFHDGSVWSLEDAVRTMADVQLGSELSDNEVADIVAFLKSLTGKIPGEALRIPVLPPSTNDTSRPAVD